MKFILFSILVTLFFVDSVYGLNRERDCQCKVNKGTNGENLYPWLVNIRSLLLPNNLTICHATILNENTLLTSATCVPSSPQTEDLLKFIKIEVEGFKNLIDIEKVIVHPEYKPEIYSAKHDIALIKVNASFKFDSYDGQNKIAPGCFGDYSSPKFLMSTLTYASLGSLKPVYINKTTGDIKGFRPSSNLVEGQGSDDSWRKCKSKVDDVICVTAYQTPSICLGGQGTPIHREIKTGVIGFRETKSIIVGVTSIPKPVHLKNGMIEMCTNEIEAARVKRYIIWIMDELNNELCYL